MSCNFNHISQISSSSKLRLRQAKTEDAAFLFNLHTDYRVMQYTGEACWKNMEEAYALIAEEKVNIKSDICRYIVSLADGTPIGLAGFRKWLTLPGPLDISFRFLYNYWNKGYAQDCISILKKAAFNNLNLKSLRAQVHPKNTISIHILEKAGFHFEHIVKWEEESWLAYHIILAK
ncbi:MAG: GNAT family N-acetyltransferase [Chitinophagales bacterium]|nr:GNAT family N-acetyltransferase [Chitinophagales bacterium]